MCGICGSCGIVDRDLLSRMCGAMVHRGPDDEGHHVDGQVMLGMRRLKIIDLETGNQPIYNEDRTVAVVYNGELYNFQETRQLLEERGHRFSTRSDTETIVHLYEEYGDECLSKLRGMFAFALWDSRRRRMLLARDRLGIKPLYYWEKGGRLLFASELKCLLEHPGLDRALNFRALHDYLTYLCVPAPDTIFRDVRKLEPGHFMTWQDGRTEIRRYWDAADHLDAGDENRGEDALGERLYELMRDSVRRHLVSDVPIGVFLSGGLDSGTLVAIASEVSDRPVKTFCIGFDDPVYNEADQARQVAERYGTDHHEYIVGPAGMGEIEEILRFFDEPFADSSAIPTYFVSKYTRQTATVALSGDGGDEAFGGYGNYRADRIGQWLRNIPSPFGGLIPRFVAAIPDSGNGLSAAAQVKKLLSLREMAPEQGHVFWLRCFSDDLKEKLYSNAHLRTCLATDSLDRYRSAFGGCRTADFINACICVDVKTVLPNDYLTKVDRASMANSLEVRVPFLDHELMEFCLSLESRFKLKGLSTKHLLKKVMGKRLPREILEGKKKGFSIPLSRWFREGFSSLLGEYLSEDRVKRRGYFEPAFVRKLCEQHAAGNRDFSKELWTLICFEIWHRQYLDG
jgi:asparagine synthase (glutamine-hydrolysing)